jgi:hypothetical protein
MAIRRWSIAQALRSCKIVKLMLMPTCRRLHCFIVPLCNRDSSSQTLSQAPTEVQEHESRIIIDEVTSLTCNASIVSRVQGRHVSWQQHHVISVFKNFYNSSRTDVILRTIYRG